MIVPMKKVSLVILDKEKKEALKTLRKIGVVHLEKVEGKGEVLANYKNVSDTLFNASILLSEVKTDKKTFKYETVSNEVALQKARRVLEIVDRKKELFDQISSATAELDRFAGWGELDPQDFEYLKEKGICLSLYEIPSDKMRLISDDVKTILLNTSKSVTRFLVLSDEPLTERPEGLPPEAFSIILPDISTNKIIENINSAKSELDSIQKEFNDSAKYLNSINEYYSSVQKDIEFENIYSGMGTEDLENENTLAWITGFVPVDSFDVLQKTAKENYWALASDDPAEEDAVPTKLKNNKLVSLIYPLTDFLGTVPGYHEYDISGWFLLFFTIFFGMIFGDGGYGLLVTVIALLMLLKSAAKGQKVSPMLSLVLLLGVATVGWGWATCTWFGLTPEQLRGIGLGFLPDCSLKVLSNAFATLPDGSDKIWYLPFGSQNAGLTTAQNLQIFCFSLALLQLSVAHLKGIGNCLANKSLKVLGEFGSLIQLWGMFYIVLMMVVSGDVFAMDAFMITETLSVGKLCVGLVGAGFALSFIFSNYEGSVVESTLESCKNIISVLLGVVNVFSDIVSYIRLWAVGLAGSAISATVNEMAGPLVGHLVMFLALVALLAFGHGLNMILNLLSVIVHGVRLNTLEFSTHLGMSWSGFKYAPFSETDK
ncbi:MAG: V-type ATPase 116kDa subunit family protein [Spirochaetia bacterium]|nr:V-type ATPase 116kDa subunit family protein [Spirochaetia bacterium]